MNKNELPKIDSKWLVNGKELFVTHIHRPGNGYSIGLHPVKYSDLWGRMSGDGYSQTIIPWYKFKKIAKPV